MDKYDLEKFDILPADRILLLKEKIEVRGNNTGAIVIGHLDYPIVESATQELLDETVNRDIDLINALRRLTEDYRDTGSIIGFHGQVTPENIKSNDILKCIEDIATHVREGGDHSKYEYRIEFGGGKSVSFVPTKYYLEEFDYIPTDEVLLYKKDKNDGVLDTGTLIVAGLQYRATISSSQLLLDETINKDVDMILVLRRITEDYRDTGRIPGFNGVTAAEHFKENESVMKCINDIEEHKSQGGDHLTYEYKVDFEEGEAVYFVPKDEMCQEWRHLV